MFFSLFRVARESEKERLMKKYESADRAIDQVVDGEWHGLCLLVILSVDMSWCWLFAVLFNLSTRTIEVVHVQSVNVEGGVA